MRAVTLLGYMTTTSAFASPESKVPVRRHGAGIGLFSMVRVIVILALWAAGFIAFLSAPLLVLAVAWGLAFAWMAMRRTKREQSTPAATAPTGPRSYQFGSSVPAAPASAEPITATTAPVTLSKSTGTEAEGASS